MKVRPTPLPASSIAVQFNDLQSDHSPGEPHPETVVKIIRSSRLFRDRLAVGGR